MLPEKPGGLSPVFITLLLSSHMHFLARHIIVLLLSFREIHLVHSGAVSSELKPYGASSQTIRCAVRDTTVCRVGMHIHSLKSLKTYSDIN